MLCICCRCRLLWLRVRRWSLKQPCLHLPSGAAEQQRQRCSHHALPLPSPRRTNAEGRRLLWLWQELARLTATCLLEAHCQHVLFAGLLPSFQTEAKIVQMVQSYLKVGCELWSCCCLQNTHQNLLALASVELAHPVKVGVADTPLGLPSARTVMVQICASAACDSYGLLESLA